MQIGELKVEEILDSREEGTIQVTIANEFGVFIGSSPSGKSTGKYEAPVYRSGLAGDIEAVRANEKAIKELYFDKFGDLIKLELLLRRYVGANTLIALESAILKAMAVEKKMQVWQIINPDAERLPIPIVNMIGGGKHTREKVKPDFQEFIVVPQGESFRENENIVKDIYNKIGNKLRWKEKRLFLSRNDEGAYNTRMNSMETLEFLSQFNVKLGLDIAASSFYKSEHYLYSNPVRILSREDQIKSMVNTIQNHNLFYVEDPLDEEDFHGFAKLVKETDALITGDDLIATHPERLKKAINDKAVRAIIVKPNQSGSLLEVKKVVELAKANDIKTIMSHRSGETDDSILADLAFAFQTDFIKISLGKGRETKWARLASIEKSFAEPEVVGEEIEGSVGMDGEKKENMIEDEEAPIMICQPVHTKVKEEVKESYKEKAVREMKEKAKTPGFDSKYGRQGIDKKMGDSSKYKYGFEKDKK